MILVTGGAGYIGSHCALSLLENGHDVVIFDSLELGHIETVNTLKNLNLKGKLVDFIKGNLQNFEDINNVFKKHKIDMVMHFAAYSQVAESVKMPEKYFKNNVGGSTNLFNAMVENGVKKVVFSSTAATYGEPVYTPIDENHPQKPINPYGETKLEIEHILDEYDKKYGLKSVRLRYFNVAGADKESRVGEWHEPETHLIPNILKSTFSGGQTFQMFGTDYDTVDGTCVRDYINVEDLISAHLLAAEYLNKGGKTDYFNLGTTDGNSVKQVFSVCEKVTDKSIPVDIQGRREGDPAILVADNQKAKTVLGWQPEKTLNDSVKSAYEWEKVLQKRINA